jgi:hypothetical protein
VTNGQRLGRPPVHGARSSYVKRLDIYRIERTVCTQFGTKKRDLTGYQRRCLRLFAEASRIVERIEPLNDDGSVNGNMQTFIAAINGAGRALERLEASMGHTQGQRNRDDVLSELARYRKPS